MPGVFVSHAYADRTLVDRFVEDLLCLGCGVNPSQIFYSSGADTGVPPGSNLNTFVRNEVAGASLVVAIITPSFQTRPFCIAELGAAWSRVENLFPLALPGLPRGDPEGVLAGMLVPYLDDEHALDLLHERVAKALGISVAPSTWTLYKRRWLESVAPLVDALINTDEAVKTETPAMAWPTAGRARRTVTKFEGVAVGGPPMEARDVTSTIIDRLGAMQTAEGIWTLGEDREFDRVYATSAAVLCLLQFGFPEHHPSVEPALAFLDAQPATLDARAAHLLNLALARGDERIQHDFIAQLSAGQISDQRSPARGSWILPQGPGASAARPGDHWTGVTHSQGAAFHACQVAGALLNATPSLRRAAKSVVSNVTGYLTRQLAENGGFLLDDRGSPSYVTLMAHALAPRLGMALPYIWRHNVRTILREMRDDSRLLARCFTVLNAQMISANLVDDAARELAIEHALAELPALWEARDSMLSNPRDVAVLGRAILYGWRAIDIDARSYLAGEPRDAADPKTAR
jgi:hypothetical protein